LVIKDLGTDATSSASIFCERAKSVAGLWMGVKHSFLFISSCISQSLSLFGEKNVALVSSLLASVFMSSLYTESLFSCLQFTALWYLEEERSTLAVLLFGNGCATRSNGVLSCGFVTHRILKHFVSNRKRTHGNLQLDFLRW